MKRSYLSQDVTVFQKYAKVGDRILDYGCGNGRILELFNDEKFNYVGVDFSQRLLDNAKEKFPHGNFIKMDDFSVPFSDKSFDLVFCLAVLHHIPSVEMRLEVLNEIHRVLKKGSKLILTVWYLREDEKAKPLILANNFKKILGLSKMDLFDILYPFKGLDGKVLAQRYIHCFSLPEIKHLVEKSGFKIIESGFNKRGKKYVNQNIYLIAEKI